MKKVNVRIDGVGGMPVSMPQLKSVYASDMDFEPDERQLSILPNGTVDLNITHSPYMIHAKLNIPLYGNIWVMADNLGHGYTEDFVDFVTEAIRTYIHAAEEKSKDIILSVKAQGHLDAAREFQHLANRGKDTAENRLYALSHAIYAAEGALFENAQKKVYANPRDDLLLGCNFFRHASDSRYSKFFKEIFDFATLPFYPGRTVPEENQYDYDYIDSALSFLLKENITPKGHPLWFGHKEVNPDWLLKKSFNDLKKSAAEIAKHHVQTYKDTILVWDAMNEAHDWANCFELNQDQLLELTKVCCDSLHEANSKAQAVVNICLPFAEYVAGRYNCYGALPKRLNSPFAYLKRVLEAGIDFDVVGIQLYFPARDMVAVDRLLTTFEKLGKPIHITEMGVNGGTRDAGNVQKGKSTWSQLSMSKGVWHNGWDEHTQANWMEQFYTIAASHSEIKALTWWDFMEPSFSGNGAFLYEDENPREIFFRLKALKGRIIK